jgi:ribulose-5-phosphate 4-epimerase/fuculose-1-phosphate aldolase
MARAIEAYPTSHAVLVRRHGVYIWGRDWVQAKTHAECYHYLFDAAGQMSRLGLGLPNKPTAKRS